LRIGFGGESRFQAGNQGQQPAIPRQPQATRSREDVQNSLSEIHGDGGTLSALSPNWQSQLRCVGVETKAELYDTVGVRIRLAAAAVPYPARSAISYASARISSSEKEEAPPGRDSIAQGD
jgi:hypothetical protein